MPILPLAQESIDMKRRPQQMGWGVQVGAGPITVCLLVAEISTGQWTPFSPNIAASIVKSTAHRADTKALVIPSIPSRLDSLAYVMIMGPVLVLRISPLDFNRLMRQLRQLLQSKTSSIVQLVDALKILHLTVKYTFDAVTCLKVASHSGPADSVIPGPQKTPLKLPFETVFISLTKLLAVQLGMIPLEFSLSAQSKSYTGTGQRLDPTEVCRAEKQFDTQVLQAAFVKSLFQRSKPMLTLLSEVGPAFLQKAEMRVMMARQSKVQVTVRPMLAQAGQLYLNPMGYWTFREMPKLERAEPKNREALTQAWKRDWFMLVAYIWEKLQLSPAILLGKLKLLSWQFLEKSTVERMFGVVELATVWRVVIAMMAIISQDMIIRNAQFILMDLSSES